MSNLRDFNFEKENKKDINNIVKVLNSVNNEISFMQKKEFETFIQNFIQGLSSNMHRIHYEAKMAKRFFKMVKKYKAFPPPPIFINLTKKFVSRYISIT